MTNSGDSTPTAVSEKGKFEGHDHQLESVETGKAPEGLLVRPARVFTEQEEKALYRKVSKPVYPVMDLKLTICVQVDLRIMPVLIVLPRRVRSVADRRVFLRSWQCSTSSRSWIAATCTSFLHLLYAHRADELFDRSGNARLKFADSLALSALCSPFPLSQQLGARLEHDRLGLQHRADSLYARACLLLTL